MVDLNNDDIENANSISTEDLFITPNDYEVVVLSQPGLDNIQSGNAVSLPNSPATINECLFNDDGSKFYTCDRSGAKIYSYNLSTDYDLTTASTESSLDDTDDGTPLGLDFNDDGSKFYLVGVGTNSIYSFNLSTAYDISTRSSNNTLDIAANVDKPRGIRFSGDGTTMFVADGATLSVQIYSLSTPYDISTAGSPSQDNISDINSEPTGIAFASNGAEFYICGLSGQTLGYDLSTDYDLSTRSKRGEFDAVGVDDASGIVIKPDFDLAIADDIAGDVTVYRQTGDIAIR